MALSALIVKFSDLRKRSRPAACATPEPQEERKTMTVPPPRPQRRKPLDAGPFAPEIGSFRLHLAAEGKAAKTARTYTEALAWFAAAHLIPRTGCTRWEQVSGHDVQRWLVHLLTRYSDAYASNQFRALQQFFRWLAEEEQLPDLMTRLRAPRVAEKLVPVFTSEELSALAKTCQGRSFAPRRDAAIIAVLTAPGSARGSWPGSATTRTTPAAATSTCGGGRSPSAARAAGRGWSGSGTGPPGPWTGISASAPGMRRRTGRSCGWG
jgi:Phage integrase, N-terminal SAM-like domain